jgi:hypothetical protein
LGERATYNPNQKGVTKMTKVERLDQLIQEGRSQEEALEILVKEFSPEPIKDKVKYIQGLNDIKEVRLMIRRAHSKKSKTPPEKKDTVARYQAEIDAGNKKMNELLALAEDDLVKLIELGESPRKLLHRWIRAKEAELKSTINKMEGTKNSKKELQNAQPITTPKSIQQELKGIHPELVEEYEDRVKRNDQGVIALNRKVRVLEKAGK